MIGSAKLKKDARLAWLTVGGLGHLRPAPGTWGSLPPAALAGVLGLALGLGSDGAIRVAMLACAIVFSLACVVLGDRAEARFGKKDPGQVVADETAGMALTIALMPPLGGGAGALGSALLAFLMFRGFDILKPWPANIVQRTPGGWGILLDDLVAGVQAAAFLWIGVAVAMAL
ncbi:MAG: phosphatidylglycerophosphatase A [Planctomycetota bacterium]